MNQEKLSQEKVFDITNIKTGVFWRVFCLKFIPYWEKKCQPSLNIGEKITFHLIFLQIVFDLIL